MLFLFLVCHDDTFDPPATIGEETDAWVASVEGTRRAGGRAAPAADATVVRIRENGDATTSGPRTTGAEQIAGFDLIEFASEAEAVASAKAHPMARYGTVEVRPMWDE